MSFKTAIENFFHNASAWFSHVFGVIGNDIQVVLGNVGPLVTEALPIVTEISAVVSGVNAATPNATLTAIQGFLSKTITDTNVVNSFIQANTGVPLANVLNNAAVLALSHTKGVTNTVLKDLQLAVQLAYAAYAAQHPATTGNKTVAAIAVPVVKAA